MEGNNRPVPAEVAMEAAANMTEAAQTMASPETPAEQPTKPAEHIVFQAPITKGDVRRAVSAEFTKWERGGLGY